MISVRLFKEEDKKRWDSYVVLSSHSTCYHQLGWKDVIEKSFGYKTYYLVSEDKKDGITGILPLVHLKSMLFGNFLVSLPYFNYGGICAENEKVQEMLLEEGTNIARSLNAEFMELRHTTELHGGLAVKKAKVSMLLELPDSSESLWQSFTSKLKSQIRRSEKEGMYSKVGREEELDSYYKVFSINMRDLGTPVYPRRFFSNILEEFPETTRICTVYSKEGIPAASGFLVGFKHRMEIPWASSLRAYNRYSPNMLLYWSSLRFACENGYRVFDFGRSTPGEGTYRFKEQWGAKPVELYWHYWMRNHGHIPELNPKNSKYRMAIKIWQMLPVALTRFIGPAIVKNLP